MKFVVFTLASVLLSGVAVAKTTDQTQNSHVSKTDNTTARSDDTKDLNKVVCRKQKITGSRLAIKTVCMTQAQWNEQTADNRMRLEKNQSMNWHGNGG